MKRFFVLFLILFAFFSAKHAFALTQEEQRAQLEQELQQTEADIAKWQAILDATRNDTASLKHDANILKTKIAQAKLLIKQKAVLINQLDQDIAAKAAHIASLEGQLNDGHDSMAQILRQQQTIDAESLSQLVLSGNTMSDFLSDVDTFQTVNSSLNILFNQIRTNKQLTEEQKAALAAQESQQATIKAAAEAQKAQTQQDEQQKEYLIAQSQSQEKTYSQILADRQAKAAQIKAELFGLRDIPAISFGTAYQYAQQAQKATGIDPAFLLAIFEQESGVTSDGTFGANTGSCYLRDTSSGAGVSVTSGSTVYRVMNPNRDVPVFVKLLGVLGLDPFTQRVSCPQSIGWGGAMGPAQFIPSTWDLFSPRIAAAGGSSTPDPWDPHDAFLAAALYLSDLGASNNTYAAEKTAACHYYSGQACSRSWYANSYGNSVMQKAKNIQTTMIDPLQNL